MYNPPEPKQTPSSAHTPETDAALTSPASPAFPAGGGCGDFSGEVFLFQRQPAVLVSPPSSFELSISNFMTTQGKGEGGGFLRQ